MDDGAVGQAGGVGEADLAAALTTAGWKANEPTFFQMLGVVVYLPAATRQTLFAFIADLPTSKVVLDYTTPAESQPPEGATVNDPRLSRTEVPSSSTVRP